MLPKTDGHSKRIAARLIGIGSISLAALCTVAGALGVRLNTSYSLPMGLYIETSDGVTTLIEFCPAGRFAKESGERGYRTAGFACSDGAVPLLKVAIASAKLAYQIYREVFSSDRWQKLYARGANKQWLLWGSTSTTQ